MENEVIHKEKTKYCILTDTHTHTHIYIWNLEKWY